jgi:RNA polymerase sigma-70 factor (ECF subfamily)
MMVRTRMKAARPGYDSAVAYLPSAALVEADDHALVAALCANDPRATREAWRRFGPLVRRILVRTLGPESELEDLSQEVFITFFERVKTLRDPRTVTAFIMSITTFKVRHHLRWRWLRRWLLLPGRSEDLDLRTVTPDGDSREALARFFKALDRLSAVDRTAFTLRFVEEMELRDVAAALELSLATTKRRLTRAWKRLSILLRDDPALRPFIDSRKLPTREGRDEE